MPTAARAVAVWNHGQEPGRRMKPIVLASRSTQSLEKLALCWLLRGANDARSLSATDDHRGVSHGGASMSELLGLIFNGVLVLSAIGMAIVVLAGKGYGGSK